ncbi:hypothetical protein [Myxococcus sp. RHSTA-1-4]|uniref:hypothetical protein n=1 Tax=Myxococcus sp. RHSTA-1-4 TaxID=2874601 RepID=UPI001CBB55CE|nr:hypothetical protein [Myxococcus sp. RHSTA-1-4]MBZ4417165.1 hypothetical protein [Myxococcus sp. RHSTA-1-4]
MSISNVFNSAVNNIMKGSSSSEAMIAAAPEDQKDFLKAQQQMQREAQVVQLITNMMKKLDDMAQSVLQNMK